ncbi:hypothetical protein AAFN60_05360 [Roseibacillus persicicus]|uniref:hypothetical protein n=1 Tax=Roseibacillus persicicus TaxID=454148 RepID=UPI00398AB6B5
MFSSGVLKALRSIFLLLGCLHVAVGPMNLLQIAAWTSMLFDYSQENTIAEAVEMTFDGDHPCSLCCAIAEAKEEESEQPAAPNNPKQQEQLRLDLYPLAKVRTESGRALSSQPSPSAGERLLAACEFTASIPSPPPQA